MVVVETLYTRSLQDLYSAAYHRIDMNRKIILANETLST